MLMRVFVRSTQAAGSTIWDLTALVEVDGLGRKEALGPLVSPRYRSWSHENVSRTKHRVKLYSGPLRPVAHQGVEVPGRTTPVANTATEVPGRTTPVEKIAPTEVRRS